MGDEADQLRQLHEKIEPEIKQLERKINETKGKLEEAQTLARNAAGASDVEREYRIDEANPSEHQTKTGRTADAEDIEEVNEKVKQFIHEFGKKVREIEEDTEEIEKLIEDAEERIKQEARELANLDKADNAVEDIESELERLNELLPEWDKRP